MAISNTLRVNIQQLSEIIGLPPSQSICEGETYINTVVVTDADTISWSAATVNNTGFSSTNQAVVTIRHFHRHQPRVCRFNHYNDQYFQHVVVIKGNHPFEY